MNTLLLFLVFEGLLLVFLNAATGYDRPRMWSLFRQSSVGFVAAIAIVGLMPKWLMRRLVRLLFNVVAAGLLYLTISGTFLLFADGLDLRVALFSKQHMIAGFSFGLPLGIYLGVHVWREIMSSRGGERWVGGVAALALLISIVTGSSLLLGPGSEGMSRYGMVHVVSSYLGITILVWHLVRAARGARRRGVKIRPRARRYPGAAELGIWVLVCLAVIARQEKHRDREMTRLAESIGPGVQGEAPTEPAFARNVSGVPVPAFRLAPSMKGCGRDRGCHVEIEQQWERSAHARASTNPFYRAVVENLVAEEGAKAARSCASCHDPVLLLSGQLVDGDSYPDPTEFTSDGVTCQVCHGLVSGDPLHGNGDYMVNVPEPILYEGMFDGVKEKMNYNITKLRPEYHAKAYAPVFIESADGCGVCHGLSKERAHGVEVFQDNYASWKKARSEGWVDQECSGCHMPMVPSFDTAGTDGRVHDHATTGSNGVLDWLAGEGSQRTTTFRRSQGRFLIELSLVGSRVEAKVSAPGVGHAWPGGVSDITQTWLEIEGWSSSGEKVAATGGITESGRLAPSALRFGTQMLGEQGEALNFHEVWRAERVISFRRIQPGASETVRWDPRTPDVSRFRARLLSRRYGVDFLEHAGVASKDAPVVELAIAEIKVESGVH